MKHIDPSKKKNIQPVGFKPLMTYPPLLNVNQMLKLLDCVSCGLQLNAAQVFSIQ